MSYMQCAKMLRRNHATKSKYINCCCHQTNAFARDYKKVRIAACASSTGREMKHCKGLLLHLPTEKKIRFQNVQISDFKNFRFQISKISDFRFQNFQISDFKIFRKNLKKISRQKKISKSIFFFDFHVKNILYRHFNKFDI